MAPFSKDVLRLGVVAVALGGPAAYVAVKRWLDDLAYRVEFYRVEFSLEPFRGQVCLCYAL